MNMSSSAKIYHFKADDRDLEIIKTIQNLMLQINEEVKLENEANKDNPNYTQQKTYKIFEVTPRENKSIDILGILSIAIPIIAIVAFIIIMLKMVRVIIKLSILGKAVLEWLKNQMLPSKM